MQIINCDKCGKRANARYCDPEMGESVDSVPYNITMTAGNDSRRLGYIESEKDKSLDLCGICFEALRGIVTKFFAESKG